MCFFLDPSPVRRVPIQTGIQRKLNFVSVRTIKGRSSEKCTDLALNSKFLVYEKSREQVKRAGTNRGLDCYIMPRLRIWRFVSSQCQQ